MKFRKSFLMLANWKRGLGRANERTRDRQIQCPEGSNSSCWGCQNIGTFVQMRRFAFH